MTNEKERVYRALVKSLDDSVKRVLDGLESAAAGAGGFERATIDGLLSGLQSRVFYLHNVHEDAPLLMQTRWAMSYLRGPLTREEIARVRGATPSPIAAAASPDFSFSRS